MLHRHMHTNTCIKRIIPHTLFLQIYIISLRAIVLSMFIYHIGGEATKSALISYKTNTHIVTPHGLTGNFKGSFKPTNIHKITSY